MIHRSVSLLIILFTVVFSFGFAEEEAHKKTVCLNMIVKDETRVITRCLDTVKPIIDYWVIVDTGSTDGTQDLIKKWMLEIPGELHERPWVNFEHNRNQALELAKGKGDYILFIDADEVLKYDDDFKLPDLTKDFYYITTQYGGLNYARVGLIKNDLDWSWKGVLHEYLASDQAKSAETLKGIYNIPYPDGARSRDPQKYHKDAKILEEALKKEPDNTRYVFYLAQSYRDADEPELALKAYEKRISMGGWDQEVYWSMLQVAWLQQKLGKPPEVFLETYQKALLYRPTRVEPLYFMAVHHLYNENFEEAYRLLTGALKIPPSRDILFVQQWIQDYGILFHLSISAYWLGHYEESLLACNALLAKSTLPENFREATIRNKRFAVEKMAKYHSIGYKNPLYYHPVSQVAHP